MKLHEILEANEISDRSILIELLIPYKKSLFTIFSREYRGEPILMVTSVFNAAQYGKIVPANELHEAVCDYLNDYDCSNEESENYPAYETIMFNSIPFSKL